MKAPFLLIISTCSIILTVSCSAGDYVVCANAGRELCGNGYDDDCDGQADEDDECACNKLDSIENINEPDPSGLLYYQDIVDINNPNRRANSRCKLGKKKCVQSILDNKGRWQVIDYPEFPIEEICGNQIDDNCNGKIEPLDTCKQCQDGQTEDIYPTVTSRDPRALSYADVSSCKLGKRECTNGTWKTTAAIGPSPSDTSCNNKDDDCNGIVDDGVRLPLSSTVGGSTVNTSAKLGEPCWSSSLKGVCKGFGIVACDTQQRVSCANMVSQTADQNFYSIANSIIAPTLQLAPFPPEHYENARWDWDCDGDTAKALCSRNSIDSGTCRMPLNLVSSCSAANCTSYTYQADPSAECGTEIRAYLCVSMGTVCSASATGVNLTVVCR